PHIEGHVARALRRLADPAIDAAGLLYVDHAVLHWPFVDWTQRPAERIGIELPQSACVAPQDLEVDDRILQCVSHATQLALAYMTTCVTIWIYSRHMRADRLLSILLLLQAHRRTTR